MPVGPDYPSSGTIQRKALRNRTKGRFHKVRQTTLRDLRLEALLR